MRIKKFVILFLILQIFGCRNYQSGLRAKEGILRENLARIREALDEYYSDQEKYPPTLKELERAGYLTKIPIDPFTRRNDTWILIYESRGSNPDSNLEPGIIDIQSGAEGEDLTGTPYKEL